MTKPKRRPRRFRALCSGLNAMSSAGFLTLDRGSSATRDGQEASLKAASHEESDRARVFYICARTSPARAADAGEFWVSVRDIFRREEMLLMNTPKHRDPPGMPLKAPPGVRIS